MFSSFFRCVLLSRVWLYVTSWAVFHQAPLSMEFSRQEHWRGLPFPSPGDILDPGNQPASPALQADSLLSGPPGKPLVVLNTKYLELNWGNLRLDSSSFFSHSIIFCHTLKQEHWSPLPFLIFWCVISWYYTFPTLYPSVWNWCAFLSFVFLYSKSNLTV